MKSTTRIIIKFPDNINIPSVDDNSENVNGNVMSVIKNIIPWDDLEKTFPGIEIGKLFFTLPYKKIHEMMDKAASMDPNYKRVNLLNFYWIDCPKGINIQKLIDALSKLKNVEMAYEDGDEIPSCPAPAPDNPKALMEKYLDAAPDGIDARFAWTKPGGDGNGPAKFIDVEQGWFFDHEDFPASISEDALISGFSKESKEHGTAVLGIIFAQDNPVGGIGITPFAKLALVSSFRHKDSIRPNNADAILFAIHQLDPGDILLIELQRGLRMNSILLPVETAPHVFEVIKMGATMGVIIIEPAGNSGLDLDGSMAKYHTGFAQEFFLKKGGGIVQQDLGFQNSKAIMVGGATSVVPHKRIGDGELSSNFGTRIDCYAWGENIATTGNRRGGRTQYTSTFGGTSGASAIIAGAAIAIQSMNLSAGNARFTPAKMREILSDASIGTKSNNPAVDKIGVMPDLQKIYNKYIAPLRID